MGTPKAAPAPERSLPGDPSSPADEPSPAGDEAARRRERSVQRQRAAADLKRARAGVRPPRMSRANAERAAREHRAALLVMVVTLVLLIAAVAVTGGILVARMQSKPIVLASPLLIYPVTQTTAGQCPAGTQGMTGQSVSGLTCYQLAQGITIRRVSDLHVQKGRTGQAYDVALTLRAADRSAFGRLTRGMVGRDLAFVVGGRLVTAPRVDMPITDGKVVITGPVNRAAAALLARQLRGS
ncbi:SecDF P1 head subdomain-containing protein [Actinomadura rubteroloni]|uniref:SecDF P1 head subdomain-containing protein n=1 Tax=Actinomadura rubteroloni TaxID=1926885 RepID=UPI001F321AD2|nr:hypothetical protein [Actinomadura rubteroloni]